MITDFEREAVDKIRGCLLAQGISQTELAKRSGVHSSHISNAFHGRRGLGLRSLHRILPVVGLRLAVTPLPKDGR